MSTTSKGKQAARLGERLFFRVFAGNVRRAMVELVMLASTPLSLGEGVGLHEDAMHPGIRFRILK